MKKQITNFAIGIDENTLKQFNECYSKDFVVKASLMPDGHSGYVAPIGSVLVTKDYIVPSWVGYDIGCGMIACKFNSSLLNKVKKKSLEIFSKVQEKIPMGMGKLNHIQNVSSQTKNEFKKLLLKLKLKKYDKDIYKLIKDKAISHLGTLGDGNHFIEISTNKDKELWLIIHSGSRGIGHKIASHYMEKSMISNIKDMNKSANKNKKFENTYPIKFDSNLGEEYLNSLNFCLDFALLNRLEMAYKVRDVLREILNDKKIDFDLWTNKNHNHVIFEDGFFIHRKGATPAKKNERGVIPANMRDGSFLVEGLGNKEFLESSSHGAGRIMSRRKAKENISLKEFENSMKGIIGTIKKETIDEAPLAYKNIYDVMNAQKKSVKIISHLKPIINWKGFKK